MNMKNKLIYLIGGILIVAVLGYAAIAGSAKQPESSKLRVAASFYPVYFFTSEVGGDKAEVKNITPAGSEPHDFEPSAQDIAKIENSRMLVLNGGVEAWADKIRETLKGKNVLIVVAGEGLLTKKLTENGEKMKDPHIWLDPILAKKEASKITEGFGKIDPGNNFYYRENEKKLDEKLARLDQKYKEGLHNCKQKDIITSHAAFGYLASRYGLNQVSIAGLSPDEEPSAKQLAKVAKFAKEHNVKYIFFEKLVSPKLSETITREIGANTLVLDPIEGLSDDEIKQGKNYFTVMEENLKNLQIALECSK